MGSSLKSRGGTALLFLSLLLHCGWAYNGVYTEVQSGPLYRVMDSTLYLSCTVGGFKDVNATKEFQFRMFRPEKPSSEINIISTRDELFTYAMYSRRVMKKEITLEHVTPNSVLFTIRKLQKDDEGDYECSVVNSEVDYLGDYSAKTTVRVIDNSLSISSPVSSSLSHYQGDSLSITCQASSNTVQHTHLSFAWYHYESDPASAKPIISLDRDFTLNAGKGFEARYQAGLIGLDKMGEATYKLKMDLLELSDQGKIYCEAQEWIQDPDRSWYSISQKEAEASMLNVRAKEVAPDKSSLAARISVQETTLQEGQELSVTCSVDAHNLVEKFFSVAWLRENVELARMGPTGVLSVGPQYSSREKQGELRAARTGDRDYHLVLQPVRTQDGGQYVCRAWPQDRATDGSFTQGAAQDSPSQLVTISATESGLSVEMEQSLVKVDEGKKLQLTCKVQGIKGQLSVIWQRKTSSTSVSAVTDVVSVNQGGVMEMGGEFTERNVKATRPAADTFTLEMDEVTPSDSGVYQCDVSEWTIKSKTDIQKTSSQSQTASVTVTPLESFVTVKLWSRTTQVTVGQNVALMCSLKGSDLPMTVTWSLQRENTSSLDNILTWYANGDISWSGEHRRYQLERKSGQNGVHHSLLINGVSLREAGRYQCEPSVFLENRHKRLQSPGLLAVMVKNPVSTLYLTPTPALTTNINTDVGLKCSVNDPISSSSYFAVTWLVQQQGGNRTVVSADRDGGVTFGPRVEPSLEQRITMRRGKGPSFELNIRQARVSDSGLYLCRVVEWLQDPRGEWFALPPVQTKTELIIIEPPNDLGLSKNELHLSTREGEEVELECSLISGAANPSLFYTIAWLYTGSDPAVVKAPLVKLDHTGLLRYPENQDLRGLQARLRLSRPTHSSFRLGIQRAHDGDSGTYECQVEQYQLDHQGDWQLKASDGSGPIMLSVNVTEHNLSIANEDMELNLTRPQEVTIPCLITAGSSRESQFQVSWFWQKEAESERHTLFVAYRNSTLQNRFGKSDRLRFTHPNPHSFNLTIIEPVPADGGLYSCEVEEWVPSVSQGWRKVAVEMSGYSTLIVNTEGVAKAVSELGCTSGVWLGIVACIAICLLLVVVVLAFKLHRGHVPGTKKQKKSLWEEGHALNLKPSTEE
ncbi:immunoglobulin superfamily member 3-like [Genypterus blacodes]|uniref:immunoglobulin superfamily member 3-like n=1 Tax=Genypterus blacodes TaxID=154954 RepID=UPI003F766F89